jgi:hypothetical protein
MVLNQEHPSEVAVSVQSLVVDAVLFFLTLWIYFRSRELGCLKRCIFIGLLLSQIADTPRWIECIVRPVDQCVGEGFWRLPYSCHLISDMGYAFCSVAVLSMWALTISAIKMSAIGPSFDKRRLPPNPILVLGAVAVCYCVFTVMAIVAMENAASLPDFAQHRIYKAYILAVALLGTVIAVGFLVNGLQLHCHIIAVGLDAHVAARILLTLNIVMLVIVCCNALRVAMIIGYFFGDADDVDVRPWPRQLHFSTWVLLLHWTPTVLVTGCLLYLLRPRHSHDNHVDSNKSAADSHRSVSKRMGGLDAGEGDGRDDGGDGSTRTEEGGKGEEEEDQYDYEEYSTGGRGYEDISIASSKLGDSFAPGREPLGEPLRGEDTFAGDTFALTMRSECADAAMCRLAPWVDAPAMVAFEDLGRSLQVSERQRTMASEASGSLGTGWGGRAGRASGLTPANSLRSGSGASSFFGGRGTAAPNRSRLGAASMTTSSLREQLHRQHPSQLSSTS